MTFHEGQKVVCNTTEGLMGEPLQVNGIYTVTAVHPTGEHVRLAERGFQWLKITRFSAMVPVFQVNELAKILPKKGSSLPIGTIWRVIEVHPDKPLVRLAPWENIWVSCNRLAKVTEDVPVPEEDDVPVSAAIPVAPKPTLVLNPQAKKEKPKGLSAEPTAEFISGAEAQTMINSYRDGSRMVSLSPLWMTIAGHIPPAWRNRIYGQLKEAFQSTSTQEFKPWQPALNRVFLWKSTSQGHAYWQRVRVSILSGDWSQYEHDYA